MKFIRLVVVTLALAACAHGKVGKVDKALEANAISKSTPIFVEKIEAKSAQVSGDKANDTVRCNQEKSQIENAFNMRIVDALRAKGYKASVANGPVARGVVISGHVTKIEHGSGAARFFVAMGAGSANLMTDFKIEDRTAKKVLSRFEVIATSGGESGAGSYLDRHLDDGAKKVAEYIAGDKKD